MHNSSKTGGLKKILPALTGIFLASLVACQQEAEKTDGPIEVTTDLSEAVSLFDSEVIESVSIIELEPVGGSVIHSIEQGSLVFYKGNIFLLDFNPDETVLRFDKNGTFKNRYGNIGKGPGEFPRVVNFFVDQGKEQIELLVSPGKIMKYTFEGKLIEEMKIPDEVFATSFAKNNEGDYLFYASLPDKNIIYFVSGQGEYIGEIFTSRTNITPTMERNFSEVPGGNLYLREIFNDTVYLASGNEIIPAYKFDFKEYNIPSQYYTDPPPPQEIMSLYKDHATMFNFFCNEDFMITSVRKDEETTPAFYSVIKNRNTGEKKIIKMPTSREFLAGSFSRSRFLTAENEIVLILQPEDIQERSEWFEQHPLFADVINEISQADENFNLKFVLARLSK